VDFGYADIAKTETREAHEKYQGYSASEINLEAREIRFRAEYAYHIHFQKKSDWGHIIDFGGRLGDRTSLIDDTTVVEIDKTAIAHMKANGRRCTESLDTEENGSADTIYCSHVLEHLEDPLAYLRLFARKLKPNGTLIIVIPYETGGFNGTEADSNGHLYSWNQVTANTMIERAGFLVKANEYATLGLLGKAVGWNTYTAMLRNKAMNRAMRMIRTLTYHALNMRPSGELIIYATPRGI
jgi:SAM-dependent methyltransferase